MHVVSSSIVHEDGAKLPEGPFCKYYYMKTRNCPIITHCSLLESPFWLDVLGESMMLQI